MWLRKNNIKKKNTKTKMRPIMTEKIWTLEGSFSIYNLQITGIQEGEN